MTIDNELSRADFVGNGVTTVFAYGFKIFDDDELQVILTDTTGASVVQTKGTHYSVSGVGQDSGGNVTMVTAPPLNYKLAIIRNIDYIQPDQFSNNAGFYPETHETAFDRLTMLVQQVKETLDRALVLSPAEAGSAVEIPAVAARAGKYLKFDSNGNPTAESVVTPGALSVSGYIQTLLDDINAATARTTLGFAGAGGTVQAANIEDNAVTTVKILNANVTTAKIADANVTTPKLADDAVDASKLKDDATGVAGAVTTDHVRSNAITKPKMAANSVGTSQIEDAAVTPAKLSAGVTAGDNTISWAKMKKTLVYDQNHNWNQSGQDFEFESYDRDGLSRPKWYVFDVEYGAGNLSGQKGEITLLHHVKAGDGTKEGKRFKIFSPTAANVSFNLKIYRISLT